MSKKLPSALAAYFTAKNNHDVDGMAAVFSAEAVVKDEGQEHRGADAIRAWMKETLQKYDFKAEPTDVAHEPDCTVVTAVVSGTFPGSPVTLRYRFKLAGQKITHLEIG
jgi:ketosteroid isomerase-like protein